MKLLIAVLALFLASQVDAKTIEIKMLNSGKDGMMVFEPGFVKADVGDTIKFVKGDPSHNSQSILVPDGAKEWKGAMDEEVAVTLDKDGIYAYICEPHISMGMAGVIQVGAATNKAKAEEVAATYKKRFMMNKDRLDNYLKQAK